jgi:glycosyltransferase involved in cell wall biosynthesis
MSNDSAVHGKVAVIVSLKFSPGHLAHIVAHWKLFIELGYRSHAILADEYKTMAQESGIDFEIYSDDSALSDIDIALIYNLSVSDHSFINRLRKDNPAAKVLLMYHEPYEGFTTGVNRFVHRLSTGNEIVRYIGRHVFSVAVLKSVDMVLLPSEEAERMYLASDARYNKNFCRFPLIFDDEARKIDCSAKKYFSYIGSVSGDHGFEDFLSFMTYAWERDSSIEFQIVTRNAVSNQLVKFKEQIEQGLLRVEEGRPQPSAVMNAAYSRSKCTWLAYRRSTQSGVLCESFMFGAPVIATPLGSFPAYVTGENGMLVKNSRDFEGIYRAYLAISHVEDKYCKAARDTFLQRFYYQNFIESFERILSHLSLAA